MNDREPRFVDTNVFLRFLTNDDPTKADKVRALFQRAISGDVKLKTSLLVIAGIVWTLESFYRLDKADIADKVEAIVSTPNLECEQAEIILSALDFYAAQNVDFIDAYHAFRLKASGVARILTYDREHFGRADWLKIGVP